MLVQHTMLEIIKIVLNSVEPNNYVFLKKVLRLTKCFRNVSSIIEKRGFPAMFG